LIQPHVVLDPISRESCQELRRNPNRGIGALRPSQQRLFRSNAKIDSFV
jgi:hypothetical protein